MQKRDKAEKWVIGILAFVVGLISSLLGPMSLFVEALLGYKARTRLAWKEHFLSGLGFLLGFIPMVVLYHGGSDKDQKNSTPPF
jgi:hypothetical protein